MQKILGLVMLVTVTPVEAAGLCWPSCSSAVATSRNTAFVTASGVGFFSFDTQSDLLVKAAETTLQRGYTKFILRGMGGGNEYQPYGYQRNGGYAQIYGRRVGSSSAEVVMFRDTDPGAANALDARAVLAGGGQ